MSEARPNPDELLRALQQSTRRGRLKLYLGMSAGVGKTYAMLRAAQELRRQNREVLVGLVETHGRAETLALVEGLSVLPRRRVRHQNIDIEEFDLDAALARKPEVLLLDELAHTNAPGSRHEKRWQDVLELLDAGIEVHSTLNVQHLESRADSVAAMTGIRVTETVPDSLLDRASEIVVIDLDPHALLKRLEEGKIYGADRARIAREEFFREENLTALREIALRVTAERVDRDLQAIHKIQHPERPWRATERLLVAVYASPFSELMIRRTRLLASILDAPWFGAYVESGREMSEEEKRLLAANLALVRELGGEVLTTLDSDPAEGLLRLCRDHNVTQIVAGKSRRRGWRRYLDPSPTETFLAGKHPFDVYIVSGDPQRSMPSRSVPVPVPVETLGREIGL